MWKNFRGCGSHCGRALEGVVRATDGVLSVLEQVITASERVMCDKENPSDDFKVGGPGLRVRSKGEGKKEVRKK